MIDLVVFFLEKSIFKAFGPIKLHKKGSRNILYISVYIRNLLQFWGQFSSQGHENIVISRQFVDVLKPFIGCHQNWSKNTIFIM